MNNKNECSKVSDFEAHILGTVLSLTVRDAEAYGVPIGEHLAAIEGHEIISGALYTSLARLVQKGLLSVESRPPTPRRGGRAKRVYTITVSGQRALLEWESRTKRLLLTLDPTWA